MTSHPSQQTDDRPAAGPVPRAVAGRLRRMSRQSKIVLAGAAAALPPYPGGQDPAAGSTIRAQLGAGHGDTVTLRRPE